ncbi:uncharacterized protein LOC113360159 [Papaver somniferum]|uniref:uncharacterized protein LOC113360159 n=1 Tax=Papaver somniferum TaxID=3469 RepID=UPI000E6FD16D|nr:uncharacterized protein LOC113360159 [Papaver somniferum]
MANLQQQLNELASQLNELPSQTQPHPKGSFEEGTSGAKTTHRVQDATTLISGRVIDNHVSDLEEKEQDRKPPTITQVIPSTHKETAETEKGNYDIYYVPRAPFPQALLPRNRGDTPNNILEVFKQVSSIITQKTPSKFKDPGCPTIACTIGEHRIEHALLDLGASVNLLPYSVYVQLELGDLKSTNVTLQLDDGSIKIPRGVVEDVVIHVESFVYPVDFIVLDTQPVSNPSGQIPVILGRPSWLPRMRLSIVEMESWSLLLEI